MELTNISTSSCKSGSRCPVLLLVYVITTIMTSVESSGADFLQLLNRLDPLAPKVQLHHKFNAQKTGNPRNMTFDPASIEEMFEGQRVWVNFTMNVNVSDNTKVLSIIADDTAVAVVEEEIEIAGVGDNEVYSGSFEVHGKRLGLTTFRFMLLQTDGVEELLYNGFEVIVLREERVVDNVYRIGIIVFASLIYLGFGCQIDLKWIWSIVKRPVAPCIGAFCQFFVMPLLGFSVAKLLSLEDEYAFGLMAMSCSPGGGGSNVYANLMRGDLDLSITMTFISTVLSLGFMPFWMYALGRHFINEERVQIPYFTIIRSLLTIVLPLLVGLAIRKWLPKVAKFMVKATKPFSIFFILYMLTYGTYVNWYMFIIMGTVPEVIPAATLVPTLGFGLGYLIAFLLKQGYKKSTTISIETGYQNASIPIIMLQGNFQQPEGDLGAVMPVATAFFMQIPLYIWYGVLEGRDRCCPKETSDENAVKDLDGENVVEITSTDDSTTNKPELIQFYQEKNMKKEARKQSSISTISYTDIQIQGNMEQVSDNYHETLDKIEE